MFSLAKLKSNIHLQPNEYVDMKSLYNKLLTKLKTTVENKVMGSYKYYVILVVNLEVEEFLTEHSITHTSEVPDTRLFSKLDTYRSKTKLKTLEHGKISDISGDISYSIEYNAVIFRPIVGDTINITVNFINNRGIWGNLTLLNTKTIKCTCLKEKMDGYVYENDVWIKDNTVIDVGSEIDIKIIHFQIDSNYININCIIY